MHTRLFIYVHAYVRGMAEAPEECCFSSLAFCVSTKMEDADVLSFKKPLTSSLDTLDDWALPYSTHFKSESMMRPQFSRASYVMQYKSSVLAMFEKCGLSHARDVPNIVSPALVWQ